ncbi:T9SS type A sorting domain-containing protein [Pseudopedobacter beijingensis]|uniref:T9SS type A sorting domain-containing protein n=1 Tax=Pseudopedobacter beijingensis TaxID=1207056 RepID=A0ABW4IJ39_9SPHI
MKKLYFMTIALILGLGNTINAQDLLVGWNFRLPTAIDGKLTEVAAYSTTGATFQTLPKITMGANLTTVGITGNSAGFGGDIKSTGTMPTTFAEALSTGTYYEIILQPKTGETVSLGTLDFKIRREFDKSPNAYVWTYSINGTDENSFLANKLHAERDIRNEFYNQVISTDPSNNGVVQPTVTLTGLTNLTSTSTVYLRLYFWNTLDMTGVADATAKGYNFALGKTMTTTPINYDVLNIKGITTLPVKLTSFKATKAPNGIKLNWQTASEENNSHFEVYKSANGKPDIFVGSQNGAGNSTQINNYSLTDYEPFIGTNYYQLRQVDIDGQYQESAIISIKNTLETEDAIKVYQKESSIELRLNSTEGGKGTLQIVDVTGRLIYKKEVNLSAGDNKLELPFNASSGVYMINLTTDNKTVGTKFIW